MHRPGPAGYASALATGSAVGERTATGRSAGRGDATARSVALEALEAIERDGSYANLRLGSFLERSGLDERDRRLVTELVYGVIRQRRALDFLCDRFLSSDPPPVARQALRLGSYQLRLTDIPDHAAVSATVAVTPKRFRGLVNAVLRRVATASVIWPDDATRLSYPDWIVERLRTDLGEARALGALEAMNRAPQVSVRDDGYVQDAGSQRVAEAVEAQPGEVVIDLCAAPGGKATAIESDGALVVAVEPRASRVGLVVSNAASVGCEDVLVVRADGRYPPLRPAIADAVIVDAPCSGLGVLRRRADARWRIQPGDIDQLAELQRQLLEAARLLVRPGGRLLYSVCTLSAAETIDVAAGFEADHRDLMAMGPPDGDWDPWGSGAVLLPQTDDTDGMALFRWRLAN